MSIKNKIVTFSQRALFTLEKHSPELMTGGAIVFGIGAVVLTWLAARKQDKVLEEPKAMIEAAKSTEITETYTEKDQKHDIILGRTKEAVAFIKLYGPAVLMGTFSIACVLGSHKILSRRNAALVAINGILGKEIDSRDNYILEKFGKDELDKMHLAGKTETVTETVKDENGEEKTIEKTVAKKGYENHTFDRCFDETNPLWKRDGQYNFTFLKNTITQLNNELHAKRFMDLNTVYDALGFPKTQAGFQNGWVCKPGHELDTYIDIGIFDLNKETTREFVYGHNPTIWLTFNCKEIIWSDIPYEEV